MAIVNYKGTAEKGQRGRRVGNKKNPENQPNHNTKGREEEMVVVAAVGGEGGQEKPPHKKTEFITSPQQRAEGNI